MTRHAPAHRPGPAPASPGRPGRRLASRVPRVLLLALGGVAALLFILAGVSLAYLTTSNSAHPAEAAAATLAAPTSGALSGTATPSTVPISWIKPNGYAPNYYTILRCHGTSCSPMAITNGNCSGHVSATSCTDTDTGLAAGTAYTYEVEAQFANWVSSPGAFTASTSTLTKLAFTLEPPSSAQATGTGTFNVSVSIEDANGNVATHDNADTVTLAIATGHNPGGTLTCNGSGSGGLTVTASSGVANFICAITKAGLGYEVTASSGSLTAATSTSFNITAGNASQVIATSGGTQSATADAAFANPLVATVEDVNGNPVSGISVTFAAPASGASVTFASSGCTSQPQTYECVVTTNASGQATSSTMTANGKLANSYPISASATGVTTPVSFSENNVATAITSLVTANGTGGTAGELNAGDTITITFSGQINASDVCSSWTNNSTSTQTASTGSVITVTNPGTSDNVLNFSTAPTACSTFNFGTIDLGSRGYVTSSGSSHKTVTFTNSTISYNGTTHVLVITLGTEGGMGTLNVVAQSALQLSLSPSILDTGGNSLSSYMITSALQQQF